MIKAEILAVESFWFRALSRRGRIARSLMAVLVLASTPLTGQIASEVFVSGLSLPVGWAQDPVDPGVRYVLEQAGRVRIIDDGVLLSMDFLDLRGFVGCCGERGLLGIAFPPDHASTGRFYVNFTDTAGRTVVARFTRSTSNPAVADPATRFDLRWPSGDRFIAQPFSNHNGGHLAFGPDGYLYIGLGDGGDGSDPGHRAQNPGTLLGKMLRIDVGVPDSDPDGYQVPLDNPFIDASPVAALGPIWSFGLRNPWRFSFDEPAFGGTGALLIADVGQGAWEEINYEPAGAGGRNYGWRNREGAHDHDTSLPAAYLPLTDPIREYDHTVGRSITGGHVYRGGGLPSRYIGQYFYSDYVSGRVWSLGLDVNAETGEAVALGEEEQTAALGGTDLLGNISAIGIDAQGELYVLNYSDGTVLRVVASASPGDLYVDFGLPYGVWALVSGAGWIPVHPFSPETMVTGDPDGNGRDDLILDFGPPYGVWMWFNHSAWVPLHPISPEAIVTGDLDGNGRDEVVVDFGSPYGTYVWKNDAEWVLLHGSSPEAMVTGDLDGNLEDDVVIDFGDPYGIYIWLNDSGWVQLHQTSPLAMVTGDLDGSGEDDVVIDFGDPYGIYAWLNNESWVQLHQTSPRAMVAGDLDGNGQDDVVIDFGDPYGIYIWSNNAAWVQLHSLTSEAIAVGDLDGDGRDEAVVDFGNPYGIFAWSSLTSWVGLHATTPESLAIGGLGAGP